MSLHAELSPEARAALQRQKRMSTISSIAISLLIILLLGLILAFVLLPSLVRDETPIIAYTPVQQEEDDDQPEKVSNTVQQKPAAPPSAMSRVITSNTTSAISVPVPEFAVPDASEGFGDANGFGDGWGSDAGTGSGFSGIPGTMSKRCSPQERMKRLLQSGGTEACETAVVKGLDWLQTQQQADGSWTGGSRSAMTGLAILAYLGHCETPLSPKYGETVLNGMRYLIDLGMKQDGRLNVSGGGHPMEYEHAIATYALGESTTFCKSLSINVPNLTEVTKMAGQYIIDHQHYNGGWAYGYAKDGGHVDLSVVAWQVQALKACYHTGIKFDGLRSCTRKFLEHLEKYQGEDGRFGYTGPNSHVDPYATLTGAGMLSYIMWGKQNSAAVRNGQDYISKNSKFAYDTPWSNLYAHYYESQAMIALGGADWDRYNNMVRDELLKGQNPDGSWKRPGGGGKVHAFAEKFTRFEVYRTCLCILMLETYYRFLPGTGEATGF